MGHFVELAKIPDHAQKFPPITWKVRMLPAIKLPITVANKPPIGSLEINRSHPYNLLRVLADLSNDARAIDSYTSRHQVALHGQRW